MEQTQKEPALSKSLLFPWKHNRFQKNKQGIQTNKKKTIRGLLVAMQNGRPT